MKEDRMLAHKLLGIMPLVRRRVDANLRHFNKRLIEPAHFHVLMNLKRHPYSVSELAERLMVSLPSMSKTVTALVKRGWVERVRLQEDRRVVHLHLTPAGTDILKEMHEQALNTVVEMLAPLTPDERRRLADGLETLYAALGESKVSSQ
jgi:DNA-binding MarR family transcriptional regulator